jgi:hypothetical protein
MTHGVLLLWQHRSGLCFLAAMDVVIEYFERSIFGVTRLRGVF